MTDTRPAAHRFEPPNMCAHPRHDPVYAVVHSTDLTGLTWLNDGEPVARICLDCHAQLPAAWGCTDCEWVEERRLCDPVPYRLLARRCPAHQETA